MSSPPLLVLTGSPGSGKTTAARCYAAAHPMGLHLTTDDFFVWPAHPIDPTRIESKAQNEAIARSYCRAASAFQQAGYAVVLDGIVGPWMLPIVAEELASAGIEFSYAVLRIDLATAVARGTGRIETPAERRVIEQMHASFSDLGPFERHALDADGLAPEGVASWLEENLDRLRFSAADLA